MTNDLNYLTAHLKEPIGQRIRRLRTEKGLSLTGLSRLSDVTWNTIARIERGEMQPRKTTLRCLLTALGETIPPPPEPPPPPEKVDIGPHLQRLRARAGLSIRQLADVLKVNRGLLWRLERSQQGADPEQARKILSRLERIVRRT